MTPMESPKLVPFDPTNITVDPTLDRYRNFPAFQAKVEEARKNIAILGLPKIKR
jgi:hypothetical protein